MKLTSYVSLAAAAFFLVLSTAACSGEGKKYGLEQNLLDYNEIEMVTFTLSGNAYCSKCQDEEIPINGMQIELFEEGSRLNQVGLAMFGGLGRFEVSGVRARAGETIDVYGQLFKEGEDGTRQSYEAFKQIAAPDDDGKIVTMALHFPSSDSDD